MEFKEIFEIEYYEGEVVCDNWVEPHCEIKGIKHPEEVPENLIIPNLIDDEYYVTEIYPEVFKDMTNLKSLCINAPIEAIGANAFEGCENLESLKIYVNCLERVGYNAFLGCVKLKKLELFNKNALCYWCGIHFSNKFANPLYYAKLFTIDGERLEDIYLPFGNGAMHIREYTFACSDVRTFVMSNCTWHIEKNAFLDCEKLKDVILSNSVRSIQEDAFKGCVNLQYTQYENCLYLGSTEKKYFALIKYAKKCEKYVVASGARVIAKGAFKDNEVVTQVELSSFLSGNEVGIQYIGEDAFKNCTNLRVLTISVGLREIGREAFENTSIQRVRIESIADWVKVEFPDKLSNPLYGADLYTYEIWKEGKRVSEVVVPGNVRKIQPYCFAGCKSIEKITIEDGVKEIGSYAFCDCPALKEVNIPDSITWMSKCIVEGCGKVDVIKGSKNKIV